MPSPSGLGARIAMATGLFLGMRNGRQSAFCACAASTYDGVECNAVLHQRAAQLLVYLLA
jgi:hypothetical protein